MRKLKVKPLINKNKNIKVQASACAKNRATTRKSTGKMHPLGPFLFDLLQEHYLSIGIILYMSKFISSKGIFLCPL